MKRIFILLVVLAVLCTGCGKKSAEPAEETTAEATVVGAPQDLIGSWVSATAGKNGYTENITLGEDGYISVELFQEGESQQMISGTYYVKDAVIYYSITEGTAPYEGTFAFRVDGRELFLDDSDGTAHYLRNA